MTKQPYPEEFKIEAVKQITERGLGNGISILIFAGIAAGLPNAIGGLLELVRTGAMHPLTALLIMMGLLAILSGVGNSVIARRSSNHSIAVQDLSGSIRSSVGPSPRIFVPQSKRVFSKPLNPVT